MTTNTSPGPTESQSPETSAFEPPTYRIFYDSDQTLQWDPPSGSKELGEALRWKYPELDGLKQKMKAAMEEFLRAERKKTSKMRRVLNSGKRVLDKMTPNSKPKEPRNIASTDRQKNAEKLAELSTNSSTSPDKPSTDTLSAKSPAMSPRSSLSRGRKPSLSADTPRNPFTESASEKYTPTTLPPIQHSSKVVDERSSKNSVYFFNWNPKSNDFQSTTKKRARSRYDEERRKKVAKNRGFACAEHRRRRVTCDPAVCPQNGQNLTRANHLILPKLSSNKEGSSEDVISLETPLFLKTSNQGTRFEPVNKSSAAISQVSPNSSSKREASLLNGQGPGTTRFSTVGTKSDLPRGQENKVSGIESSYPKAPPQDRDDHLRNYRTSSSPVPVSPLNYQAKPLVLEPCAIDDNYDTGFEEEDFPWISGNVEQPAQATASPSHWMTVTECPLYPSAGLEDISSTRSVTSRRSSTANAIELRRAPAVKPLAMHSMKRHTSRHDVNELSNKLGRLSTTDRVGH